MFFFKKKTTKENRFVSAEIINVIIRYNAEDAEMYY